MAAAYATPPRPGPGGYMQTPAQSRLTYQTAPSFGQTPGPAQRSQDLVPTSQTQVSAATQPALRQPENLTAAERAAKAINDALEQVKRANPLDNEYSTRYAYNYDMHTNSVWAPFQKSRSHNIPDQIFEQLNRSEASTNMGLFAEIHYAWVTVDNALYMWDYTLNMPELLGFEDQPHSIEMVKLAKPKRGVFLDSIKHMVVLATVDQVMLLGLGEDASSSASGLTLFQTGMSASVRGLGIQNITSSERTGRVFFGCRSDNDVRELKYQAQDSWFSARCSVVNHTKRVYDSFTTTLNVFWSGSDEHIVDMDVDDSRNILYALSTKSTIRAFLMSGDSLEHKAEVTMQTIQRSVDFAVQGPISHKSYLVSISTISAEETRGWVLLATTNKGYRIYFTGSFEYAPRPDQLGPLRGIAANHVRTPPLLAPSPGEEAPPTVGHLNNYLTTVTTAKRFPPGYFLVSIARTQNADQERLFISVPDAQADSSYVRPQHGSAESAAWVDLHSQVMDIGFRIPYKGATSQPQGFGYELAVQFDEPVPEFAILTNTGVHVLQRRRFVDSLAGLIRQGGGREGFQNEIQKLIIKYGRQEVLSNALAVACGQSIETSASRLLRINDPEVLEVARKVYIEHGGRPSIDQNAAASTQAPVDAVRPSPRFEATIRYVSRLIRSTWKQVIQKEARSAAGYQIISAVEAEKLRAVQENLTSLQKFFNVNKSFIRGLSGPDDLSRQANRDDEIALQGEHRAFHSLVKFVSEMIEALSFVLVLFEERVVEIVPLLPERSRNIFMSMTFETLVATKDGMEVAKDLVKAIVNRNIAKGSNVETIAEALRRKCGNFCSSDDVVIFKAQEQLKRASEAQANAEYSRNLLNESLKLFEQVSHSLPQDYLQSAVQEYIDLQFFAGAIQLALKVAYEHDKTNDALAWMNDGRVESDPRKEKFQKRNTCYDLIHNVLEAMDTALASNPPFVDGRPSLSAVRRDEAYDVISRSKDEVFLTNLYNWYLSKGWHDRLLATDSTFIVTFLQRKATEDITHADLLWRFYGQNSEFHEAAKVQLSLAQSAFPLSLDRRLEYLSRARANASAFTTTNNTTSRKTKQKLLTEINGLIDVANIQSEILQRLRDDPRLQDEARNRVLAELDGPIKSISDLYNSYADNAGYYDVCLYIYAIADHRDASQIKNTWSQFLDATHNQAVQQLSATGNEADVASAYELVAEQFREVGGRLKGSEAVFPIPVLIEMLERYNIQQTQGQQDEESSHWIPDIFIELESPYELLYDTLETIYLSSATPNARPGERRVILSDLLYIVERWLQVSYTRAGQSLFGGEQGQMRIEELLVYLTEQQNARQIGEDCWQRARALRGRVEEMVA
ncbi:hypothetical protein LTR70_004738 [Exophiala xenobiotica]|uniref:Non-repetitive nucleoporin n=1 Tax=Lithohypha guttulata TaxID=1690604 RepID=A0ABR0KC84_9EURO|nr:hypothetical protein LTR24_004354 [Lithohypha guttulata]KAK5319952.1 hypothetical protein LTR70_004738 [Exophiala xenobiotica]